MDVQLSPKIFVSGFIAGQVLDATTGDPVAGANVWVGLKGQTVLTFPRVTGDEGAYIVGNLGRGEYDVKVQAPGFEPATKTVTKSSDALGLTVDFSIAPPAQPVEGEGAFICAPQQSNAPNSNPVPANLLILLLAAALLRAKRVPVNTAPPPTRNRGASPSTSRRRR